MDLSVFISETLKGLIKGVKDTQDFAKENGARINPHVGKWDYDKTSTVFYGNEDGARAISNVQFDIAVTASNQSESGINGGIQVFNIQLGGKNEKTITNEVVSRIKFDVPVALPNVKP